MFYFAFRETASQQNTSSSGMVLFYHARSRTQRSGSAADRMRGSIRADIQAFSFLNKLGTRFQAAGATERPHSKVFAQLLQTNARRCHIFFRTSTRWLIFVFQRFSAAKRCGQENWSKPLTVVHLLRRRTISLSDKCGRFNRWCEKLTSENACVDRFILLRFFKLNVTAARK